MFTFDNDDLFKQIYESVYGSDPVKPVEAPKTCPVVYRYTGPEYHGQIVIDERLSSDLTHMELTFANGHKAYIRAGRPTFVARELQHTFPNTGCKKSWCNVCGAEGYFNIETGTYT